MMLSRLWISSLGWSFGSVWAVAARLESVAIQNDVNTNFKLTAIPIKRFKYYDNFLLYMDRIILFNN